jgi:hypothetical protein
MSLSVAAAVQEWSRAHPVRVLWHGGEPLATGVPHFRALLARFGFGESHPVRHAVHTNGTLIDQAWCELFATTPVEVAVGIDGPAPRTPPGPTGVGTTAPLARCGASGCCASTDRLWGDRGGLGSQPGAGGGDVRVVRATGRHQPGGQYRGT